jgi:hypothetical protein
VGGDSYDYHDYLGIGSVSFVPTLYVETHPVVRFSPSDPSLGDLNRDGVPDLAIGRFPVRTVEELSRQIEKTLSFDPASRDSIFAADLADSSASFTNISEELVPLMPRDWRVERAYLDQLPVVEAKNQLLASLNGGVALASFVGHSGPMAWTFQQLFTAADAVALSNARPFLSLQWGCWNGYHSLPQYNTLSHELLLRGSQGAVAVFGASTLTETSSDREMALRVIPRLMTPGKTLGEAILEAKIDLAQNSGFEDVILGMTLLGDPALILVP